MKKNIKNVLLTLVLAITVCLGMGNVQAIGVDATKCKDGKVYTNYYFLLDANTFTGEAVTAAGGVYNFMQTWTHTTQGLYSNNIIQINGMKSTGFDGYDDNLYSLDKGAIPVTNNATAANGLSNWSFKEYYDILYDSGNHNGGSWTDGDKAYVVSHAWANVSSTGDVGETKTDGVPVTQENRTELLNASVILGTAPSIGTVGLQPSDDQSTDFKIQIARNYANPQSYTGGAFAGNVTPVQIDGKSWYLNAAMYYVQYCEKGTAATDKTITYDANTTDTVAGLPSKQTFTAQCEKISTAVPTRSGYTFSGWSATKGATTADSTYAGGKDYCGASITLYAVWSKNGDNYSITYDANGGKDAPGAQNGTTGSCLKISDTKPSRDNYTFLGWSTDQNATKADPAYAAGQEYCGTNGNLKLYAVWSGGAATTENPKTGMSNYLIAFGIVVIAAGVALVVAKKKNLFKQL